MNAWMDACMYVGVWGRALGTVIVSITPLLCVFVFVRVCVSMCARACACVCACLFWLGGVGECVYLRVCV